MLYAHKHLVKKNDVYLPTWSFWDKLFAICISFDDSFFKDTFDISQIVAGIESWRMLQLLQPERDFVRRQDVMFNL